MGAAVSPSVNISRPPGSGRSAEAVISPDARSMRTTRPGSCTDTNASSAEAKVASADAPPTSMRLPGRLAAGAVGTPKASFAVASDGARRSRSTTVTAVPLSWVISARRPSGEMPTPLGAGGSSS